MNLSRKLLNIKKLIFLFLVILLNNSAFAQIPNYVPLNGLKAFYPFNGNANDESGNGNNGTVNGATLTTDRFGNLNSAYNFNGSGNNIVAPNHPSLNPVNLSISVWVKIANNAPTSIDMDIVSKDGECNDRQYEVTRSSLEKFRAHAGNGSIFCAYDGLTTPIYDLWYHVVETYDGNTLKLYVNGQYEGSPICIGLANLWQTTQPLRIGGGADGSCSPLWSPLWFNGIIDDVGIWSRALTPCEVTQLYTGIIQSNPTVNLGNDTTLAQGSTLQLNASNAGSTYLWSTGATTQTIYINTSGTYWVKVTNSSGCFVNDTINIHFILPCSLLCNKDFEESQVVNPGQVILLPQAQIPCWNTTASDGKIEIWGNGAYGVNSYSGSQFIELNANFVSTLYQDFYAGTSTNISIGFAHRGRQGIDSMSVSIGPIGGPYTILGAFGDGTNWNYYSINYLLPNQGSYSVRFNSIYATGGIQTVGNFLDDIQITLLQTPIVNLGNDTTLAQGSTLQLNASNAGSTYLWCTGATTQTININTSGTYWVKVTNISGCFGNDTIHVNFDIIPSSTPMVDTIICSGESVTFTANVNVPSTWEYLQNFENTVGNEWSDTNRITYNNSKVSGPFGSQIVNLNLINLPTHDSIEISFDLYMYDTWDGNTLGPDFWSLRINNDTIINTTFSNFNFQTQSYPQNYLTINPSLSDAFIINLPVRCLSAGAGTSLYKIIRKIFNNSNTLQIKFEGKPAEDICNESWSIDNVKVKLLNITSSPHYHWSTGDTTQTITVTPLQTTTYYLTVTNGGANYYDTATVYVLNPTINNGVDTTICLGDSVTLSVPTFQQNICNKTQLPSNLQQGLVAFYPFCGNANDESGNGNNGTVNGATLTNDRFGNANNAYSFDGVTDNITNLSIVNEKSISVWINVDTTVNCGFSVYTGGNGSAFQLYSLRIYKNDVASSYHNPRSADGHRWGIGFESVHTGVYVPFDNIVNGWHHIAVSWDGGVNVTMQVDGIATQFAYLYNAYLWPNYCFYGTNSQPYILPYSFTPDNGVTRTIGDQPWNTNPTFKFSGLIDEISIYNRVLSFSEMSQLYNLVNPSTASSIHWSTNDTTQSITVHPTQTTIYTVTMTNGNTSCSDTMTVNVNNPQFTLGNDTTVCQGQSITLHPNQAFVSYLWSTGASSQTINVSTAGLYWLRVTNANGCVAYDTINVTVHPNPIINIQYSANPICAGSSTTLTAGGGTTYSWSNGLGTSNPLTVSPATTTTYTVTGTSLGCTGTANVTITVNPHPTISISASANPVCAGSSTNLTASGASTYVWSNGLGTSNPISITPATSGTYSVTGTSAGCTGVANIAITVTPHPIINVAATASPLCIGSSTTLSASGASTYSWSNGLGTSNPVTVSPITTTTYTVTGTLAGCTGSVNIIIYVYPYPIVSASASSNTICSGTSTTLTASGATNYIWSGGATGSLNPMTVSPLATTSYTVIGNSYGCADTASIIITVNPLPVVSVSPVNPSFCLGDTVSLLASSNIVGTTYVWNTGANSNTINVSPVNTTTYNVIGSSNNCKDTTAVTVTINASPIVSIAPLNPSICKGDPIVLTASSNLPSTSFVWSNAALSSSINVSPIITTTYFVVGSANQCKDTAFVNVSVKPLPVITVTANNNPVCEGESTTLTANSNLPSTTYVWDNSATGNSLSITPPITTYYYTTGTANNCHDTAGILITVVPNQIFDLGLDGYLCTGEQINLSANLNGLYLWSTGSSSQSINVSEPGVYWLRVDNNGCAVSDTIEFKKCSEIWVPNVFTPNQDGKNDYFKPLVTEIQTLSMYIFNRWGEMIFETSDFAKGWDGSYKGKEAMEGVYYWVMKYKGYSSQGSSMDKEINGSVTLLR